MKYTVSLKGNRSFRRLYAKGRSLASGTVVLYCRRNGSRENRLGLTVGTKVGKAVVRNRVRRRFRELFRRNSGRFNGVYDVILVGRTRAADMDFARLERQYLSALEELGMLLPEEGKS